MPEKQDFQIPQELREFAEKNVEQARVAYGQLMEFMTQAVRAWSTAPSTVMASGYKVVQERAIQFAKKNADAGFTLASELAKAKDLQDILRLQSNFAQTQMQSYARQAQELELTLLDAGVPCARVNNFKEVFDHPQIIARGVVQEVSHPRLGSMRTTRNPVLLDHDGPGIERHAPMLGEHSCEVLDELGFSPDAIRDLLAAGVTRVGAPAHEPTSNARGGMIFESQ